MDISSPLDLEAGRLPHQELSTMLVLWYFMQVHRFVTHQRIQVPFFQHGSMHICGREEDVGRLTENLRSKVSEVTDIPKS